MNLSEKLKYDALRLGLCNEWAGEWKNEDSIDVLLKRYKDGIDFCIAHDWPSVDEALAMFEQEDLVRHDIFVDVNAGWIQPVTNRMVFLGESTAELVVNGNKVVDLVVKHNSNVFVIVRHNAIVHAKVFDNARICIHNDGNKSAYVETYNNGKIVGLNKESKIIVKQQDFNTIYG